MEHELELVRHLLLFAVLIIAVYTDLARGRIYNWCTIGGLVAGLLISYALGGFWDLGLGGPNLVGALLGAAVALLVFAWPYFKGGIAAGDVKLMAAVGAIGGLQHGYIAYALFYCSLVGAVMALLALIWRGRLLSGVKGALRFAFTLERISAGSGEPQGDGSDKTRKIAVPYGFAIAIGSIIAYYLVEVPR